jgi:tetratricopeptide (TPR) repeat protein
MNSLILAAILHLTLQPSPQTAAHHHDPQLGAVDFPISCNGAARDHFNRAVSWLHSFEYEEAERTFRQAASADPACGMSQWGVAMSNYHPLWAPPTPSEMERGRAAVAAAQTLGAATDRERAWIDAIAAFYADPAADHRTRSFAYSAAMEDFHRRYPQDMEGSVFYALSLVATGTMELDGRRAREISAAAILDDVMEQAPDHPGVAHYLIHSFDYPDLAHLALPAARRYAGIAPASAHAQHMPSHIFTRLGFWEEAARSNLAAHAAAQTYAREHGLTGAWDEQLHAMDYLAYAYLQDARDDDARQVLEELNAIQRVDPPNFKVAHASVSIPARFALERRQWQEAAALAQPPNTIGLVERSRFPWAEAEIHTARSIGAARSGNAEQARAELAILQDLRKGMTTPPGEYDWASQVEIQSRIAAGWLAQAEGQPEQALDLMRSAADLDDSTEKHPVTPGAVLPAREQLGELLLEIGRPADAQVEFEAALVRAPNRFVALYGAARAAELSGDVDKARRYYSSLLDGPRADNNTRPEIREARAWLSAHPAP